MNRPLNANRGLASTATIARPSRVHVVLAALLGALHAAGFGPVPNWAVALVALTLLCALMQRASQQGASATGQAGLVAVFSMVWFGAGLSWLYISMHDVGGMPAPMAALAVILFAAYLSLYPTAATWWAWRTGAAMSAPTLALRLAGAWTLAEIARGWVFTGFPWLAIGYGQIDGPLEGLAPLGGVYAIGGITVAIASLTATALISGPRRLAPLARTQCLLAAVVLIGLPLASSPAQWTRPVGPALSVRLLQGNVPQSLKFSPEVARAAMGNYLTAYEAGTAALTILPETAWTIPWENTPEDLARRLMKHAAGGHAIAVGMPLIRMEPERREFRPTNSVALFAASSEGTVTMPPLLYDKRHLVPFGEFIPWGFGWFVRMMQIPLGNFGRGSASQQPFPVGGQKLAFNICYEDLFGEESIEAVRAPGHATILANISNIGWFGRSHALPQHLQISRMRALETGRPMIRATNTGMTAHIDARGQVIAALPAHTSGALDIRVQGTEGLTPYVRFGNWPALGLALIAVLMTSAARRRRHAG